MRKNPKAAAADPQPTIADVTTGPPATDPKPATLPELRAALPGVDSDFIIEMLEAAATVPVAIDAWMKELNSRYAKVQQELVAARGSRGQDRRS
jgi:hypothetical protein